MSTCIFVLFVTLNVVDCGGTFYCELVKMLWPNNQATTSDKTLETVPFIFSFCTILHSSKQNKEMKPPPQPLIQCCCLKTHVYNSGLDISLYFLTLISILQVIVLCSFKVKFVKTIVLLIIFKDFLWNVK